MQPTPAMPPHATLPAVLVARRVFDDLLTPLRACAQVTDNPTDTPWRGDEWLQRLKGQVGVMTTVEDRVDAAVLAANPQLRIVANMAVGYNNIDVAACTQHGVVVTNTPGVLTEATADMAFALLLATARRVTEGERLLRAGQWQRWAVDFMAGVNVHGTTLGLWGMGRIGQAIARRAAHGFGMQVIYHNRNRLSPPEEAAVNARYVGRDELLAQADHLMLTVPYGPATHHLVGAAELAALKPTATLINMARGGVVDDAALAHALAQGHLAGAGLDVFEGEPQVHPGLLAVPNVVLTPHIGSATVPTRRAMAQLAIHNLVSFFTQGQVLTPVNTVQPS